MGTSHTERDSVEADKIRPNNNSNKSNKENHDQNNNNNNNGRDGECKRIQTRPLQRSANHTVKYCQGARMMSRPLTVAKG